MSPSPRQNQHPIIYLFFPIKSISHTGLGTAVEQKEWAQHSFAMNAQVVNNYTKDFFSIHSYHPWKEWSEILVMGIEKDLKGKFPP